MGKYLQRYRTPAGSFNVQNNSLIQINYSSSKHYLDNYNTSIFKIVNDLQMLERRVGHLRGYLSTEDSASLNREGFLLMQSLENFISHFKTSNLEYYKSLNEVLYARRRADNKFNASSTNAINKINKS